MSRLDDHASLTLKLFFASLDDIRTAVEKILVPPPLARNPILHFRQDALDLDWVERQAQHWAGMKHRLWGLFYRPVAAPHVVCPLTHCDTFSHNIPWAIKCNAIFIRTSGEAAGHAVEWPIHEFEYYQHGESRRFVRAMNDDPWEFFERGERFDWEYADQYQRRRIKDRVTRRMIVDYTRQFGVDLEDDSFWQSDHDALYWHYDLPQSVVPPFGNG